MISSGRGLDDPLSHGFHVVREIESSMPDHFESVAGFSVSGYTSRGNMTTTTRNLRLANYAFNFSIDQLSTEN